MGAEATLVRKDSFLHKLRIPKTYRLPQIDEKIRKSRTKKEIKGILKAKELGILVPELYPSDDAYTIIMDYIDGKRLRDVAKDDSSTTLTYFEEVGTYLAKLHQAGLVHGDLTTSNILITTKAYFIDFGLSYFSQKIEDMAVDIHVFEEALESTHHEHAAKYYASFLEGYKQHPQYDAIMERLDIVRGRGRYKKR